MPLRHTKTDKEIIINTIVAAAPHGAHAVRRATLYLLIRFLFGGKSPDPARSNTAKRIILRSFKSII